MYHLVFIKYERVVFCTNKGIDVVVQTYYKSHEALALAQRGILGGAIGTVISTCASGAMAVGATNVWFMITKPKLGPAGLGGLIAMFAATMYGMIQGAARYPVHYSLNGKLDTTAKKIMGLMLEFIASTFVFWLIDQSGSPFHAAIFYSALSFPCSILACTIVGIAFTCIGYAAKSCFYKL